MMGWPGRPFGHVSHIRIRCLALALGFLFLPPTADCRLSFPACDSFILPLLFAVCTFLPLSAHFCLLWLISVSYFARWPYA